MDVPAELMAKYGSENARGEGKRRVGETKIGEESSPHPPVNLKLGIELIVILCKCITLSILGVSSFRKVE